MKLVRKAHRAQSLRHIAANKLVLALTVLEEFRNGKSVSRKVIGRAIQDLKSIMRWVDRRGGTD